MEISIKGLRVLITAGASGIGRVMAETFTRAGASVHLCDISQEAIEETRKALPAVTTTLCDVCDIEQVDRLFADVRKHLGGLDVLVNNAGTAGPTAKIEEMSIQDWRRCVDVNLNSMFYCIRLAMPMLKEAGGGSIINMSSVAGRFGFPYRAPYASAKWGVVGLTKSLSIEVGPDRIRVNAIQPGAVEGDRMDRIFAAKAKATGTTIQEQKDRTLANTSMHTMVSPRDIANMALYLISDLGKHVTGQAISVCAGVEMLA